jgi:protoporphyrinogen oxidase
MEILKMLAEQNVDITCKNYEDLNGLQILNKRFSETVVDTVINLLTEHGYNMDSISLL